MIASGWYFVFFLAVVVAIVIKLIMEKQALATRFVWLIFLFFAFTIGYVAISQDLSFDSPDSIVNAIDVYFSWIGSAFKNIKTVTGEASNIDWTSGLNNSSISK